MPRIFLPRQQTENNISRRNFLGKPAGAQDEDGLIALISVLIFGALAAVIAIGLASRSVDEAKISFSRESGTGARFLADAAAEEAIKKIKENGGYRGNENPVFPSGNCQILPVTVAGSVYTVQTSCNLDGFTQKIMVVLTRAANSAITIHSWRNISDF